MSYFIQAGDLLIEFFFGAAITLFLLRLLAEYWRAPFHNPVSQFVYRTTNPVLAPLRRLLRNLGRFNLSALVVALALELVKLGLQTVLAGHMPRPVGWLLLGVGQLLDLFLLIYIVLVFVWSLASMLGGDPNHPLLRFVAQITEPPMRPLRRRMPTPGGIDFSPMVALLILFLLRILVAQPLIVPGMRLILGA
jgi:YggT family protein